jgi:hypothetical protein
MAYWVRFGYKTVNGLERVGFSLFFDVFRNTENLGELIVVPNNELGICKINFTPDPA